MESLKEKCSIVWDGTSYFIVPADHELEEGEEINSNHEDIDEADEVCVKLNSEVY